MSNSRRRAVLHRNLIAAAAALALGPLAQAGVTASGSFGTSPAPIVFGPGNTSFPSTLAFIGSPGVGSLTVDGGSFLELARLSFGAGGTGSGSGLISGAGSRVVLAGDAVQRLAVGEWGTGQLTVNQGALLDTSGNQAACLLPFRFCDSFVGGAAGDTALMNIDGSGTRVRIGQNLFIAQPGLAVPSIDGYTFGVPGGTTRGTVNVTGGASLVTDRAQVGPRHWSTAATGQERNIAEVNVRGAGSNWTVVGGPVVNNVTGAVTAGDAFILTANDRNAWATINVTNGGLIEVQGPSSSFNGINLTNDRGRTDMLVSAGTVRTSGPNGVLQVGRRLGSANLTVEAGGVVEGLYFLSVGRDGSFGTMVLDGAGSRVSVTQYAEQALQGANRSPAVNIGRNGSGVVTVRNGALFEVSGGSQTSANSPNMLLGNEGAASSGTLAIEGAGSEVRLTTSSLGGGPNEPFNPYFSAGYDGRGTLSITGGGKLTLQGNAISTVADTRTTQMMIGGRSDTTPGGNGVATIGGAGSELRVLGSDPIVWIGRGPSATGQLAMRDQAQLSTMILLVGRSGGVGTMSMDDARVDLAGQQSGNLLSGAGIGVGSGIGSVGVLSMNNGSLIRITNPGGTAPVFVNVGGTGNLAGGDGSITLTGGSRIELIGATPDNTSASIGRSGSGLMRLRGASSFDLGQGALHLGRLPGSDGTLIASEASVITAGWVGVGRDRLADGSHVDGGTGTMVLNGATLNARDVVIGTNGFLGGTAGSINVSGSVTNYGIFSPGNSPGRFTINGNYVAGAGSRLILEVQADGQGGFLTDEVLFGETSVLDLGALGIEFRFLGNTDPNAFQASGRFDIDTFVARQTAGGGRVELDHALFSNASFSARADGYSISNFSFSADGGAAFVAVAVPEPETWLLMLAGAAAVLGVARRRGSAP